MKLAYSTLACPGWSAERALEQARGLGFDGVEWRLIDGAIAGPGIPAASCRAIRSAAERLGLSSVALGSSIQLAEAQGADRDRVLAEGRAMLELAAEMGAGWLRVFIGKLPAGTSEEQAVDRARDALAGLLPGAEQAGVGIALEVHPFEGRGKNVSGTSDSELCRRIAADLPSPRLGILWDVANPIGEGESVAETWANVRGRLAYLHVKDLRERAGGGFEPELPNEGVVPLGEIMALLKGTGFDGWLSFEWEKRWHPSIAEPEVALPRYVRVMRELLA
jgi:sugar phosphate isomerase/epimerase